MNATERRVAIVTGAAGGLGRSLALGFAREGFIPVLLDRNREGLARLMSSLDSQGFSACPAVVDVAQRDQVVGAIDEAANAHGRIDVLVNNAAICRSKPMLDLEESDWDEVYAVNVKGLYFALQAAVRHMKPGSSIINIASVAGRLGRPALLHYAASKSAVISITRSAAAGLAERGIRVNAVAPGMIETEMYQQLQQSWSAVENAAGQPSPASTLIGRTAHPDEVAAAVLYLAGDSASYITGQTLNVCGGIVMS